MSNSKDVPSLAVSLHTYPPLKLPDEKYKALLSPSQARNITAPMTHESRKIALLGLQSSGASTITFLFGQSQDTICIVDLWSGAVMPPFNNPNAAAVIGKFTLNEHILPEQHYASFAPHTRILVIRHPLHNYIALSRKKFRDSLGKVDTKFRLLEKIFIEGTSFDDYVFYEDIIFNRMRILSLLNKIGLPADASIFDFPRRKKEILKFNSEHSEWCRDNFNKNWGFGNLHRRHISHEMIFKYATASDREHVQQLCPHVFSLAEEYYREHIPAARRFWWTLKGDVIGRPVKEFRRSLRKAA